jgi:hypothetical protein
MVAIQDRSTDILAKDASIFILFEEMLLQTGW